MLHDNVNEPNWSSAPGSTILDILDEREISLEDLAKGVGFTLDQTQRLIEGELELKAPTARRLAILIGGSVDFWLSRECDYRAQVNTDRRKPLRSAEDLFRELPFRDMESFGWINHARTSQAKIDECMEFFGVSSLAQWQGRYVEAVSAAAFHASKAYDSSQAATAAWLRQGELQTRDDIVSEWKQDVLRETVGALRKLTWFKSPALFIPKIHAALAVCGVKFAVVRSPKGCRASGAVRVLDDGFPIIQLSARYLSDDQFWFSLFHEIGHLMLHYDQMPIIEDSSIVEDILEKEANNFAADIIVPSQFKEELYGLGPSKKSIINFSKKIGVAPGLIVGQLQHAGILGFRQMHYLKRRYKWS